MTASSTVPPAADAAAHRRYADRMFGEVLDALRRRDHRAFRRACDDVYASTLEPGAVGAAALHAAGLAVQQAWDLNWQPAELDHALRRFAAKIKAPAATTTWMTRLLGDATAARMRAHAPQTVTARWHSQLEVLEAAVWWGGDEEHLAAFGQRHGLDRVKVLGGALELMRWIHHDLPRLEKAGHAPGTPIPPRRSTSQAAQAADRRMLDRIRALLAKAESTGFPEEAEAFTAKAQQLMARHSIDHALLDATAGGGDGPDTRRIVIANPYEGPKALLLQVVAKANGCRAVNFKEYGLSTLVGFEPDLDAVELLYTSLLVQAVRAMTAANARPDRHGRNDVRSFRQAFLSAYADRIGERLTEAAHEAQAEAAVGTDLVPVLAARTEAVATAFDELFPNRTTGTARIGNLAGWASGRAAADRADLAARAPLPR